jgi:hypothetical protein
MLKPSDLDALAGAVVQFMSEHRIDFRRDDPKKYFAGLSHVNAKLTLPLVAKEKLATVVLLKNVYAAWNFAVDDEMDCQGTRHHLDESMKVLLRYSRQKQEAEDQAGSAAMRSGADNHTVTEVIDTNLSNVPVDLSSSGVARAIGTVLANLPPASSRASLRELFHFDLWTLMTGFFYEDVLNKMPTVANSLEYRRYSTLVTGIKHYLVLDCLFASQELESAAFRNLREGYENLGISLKLAADIGSLRRELTQENNSNSIRIQAMEEGLLDTEATCLTDETRKLGLSEYKQDVLPKISRIRDDVKQEAEQHLSRARAAFAKVSGVDTSGVLQMVSWMVKDYFERDRFYGKS